MTKLVPAVILAATLVLPQVVPAVTGESPTPAPVTPTATTATPTATPTLPPVVSPPPTLTSTATLPNGAALLHSMHAAMSHAISYHESDRFSQSFANGAREVGRGERDYSSHGRRILVTSTLRSTGPHGKLRVSHIETIRVGQKEATRTDRQPWDCRNLRLLAKTALRPPMSTRDPLGLMFWSTGPLQQKPFRFSHVRTVRALRLDGVPVWHVHALGSSGASAPHFHARERETDDFYIAQSDDTLRREQVRGTVTIDKSVMHVAMTAKYDEYGAVFHIRLPAACHPVKPPSKQALRPQFAGRWIVHSTLYCREDFLHMRNGEIDCSSSGRDKTITEVLTATSSKSGWFTFRDTTVYVEHHMNTSPPPRCGRWIYNDDGESHGQSASSGAGYTWRCRITSSGTGFFLRGYTHHPDFWIASETATFRSESGVKTKYDPRRILERYTGRHAYPFDLGIPAVPGSYTTRQILRWQGNGHAVLPPHFRLQLLVAHGR